jgi:hypothetical protein
MAKPQTIQLPGLAERLHTLFKRYRRPDGLKWSSAQVAQHITESGEPFSLVFLQSLRLGKRTNARPAKPRAIAAFFGVPVTYFYAEEYAERLLPDPEEAVLRQVEDDPELREVILLCARTLQRGDPDDVAAVRDVLEALNQVQREAEAELPPSEESETSDATGSPDGRGAAHSPYPSHTQA